MAMTVLMKQTRQGDAGAVLSAGSTYTVTEALGAQLVGNGFATDVNGALQPDIDFDVSAKVNGVTGGISLYAGGELASMSKRNTPVRVATFGDSRADTSGICKQDVYTTTFAAKVSSNILPEKFQVHAYYPQAYLVANGGVGGQTTTNMVARDSAAYSTSRKAVTDIISLSPDVAILRAGSINDFLTAANAGNWSSLADTAIANHTLIINRFLAAGIFVIDEGEFGTDGTGATSLPHVLLAIQKVNAAYKAYAATLPTKIQYIDLTGITTDSTGLLLPNMALADATGRHASLYAQNLIGKEEARIFNAVFGASGKTRYQGVNAMKNAAVVTLNMPDNALFSSFNPSLGGYGAPNGYSIGANANGTRQNGKVEVIDGKSFYTIECNASAAGSLLAIYSPLDVANFAPAIGDIYAIEMDYVIAGVTNPSATPAISSLFGRFDFTIGANTININNQISQVAPAMPISGYFKSRIATVPFQFPADTAALASVEFLLSVTVSEITTWKLGVSNPRLVKLGQPVLTT